jgi:signal transduction histidine kinase
VVQEAKRLTRLVDNSLAYARVTDLADVYHFEPLTVDSVLQDALRGFGPQLSSQNFTIDLNMPNALPPITGDRLALGLLFDNLIDNAVRYSGSGHSLSITASENCRVVVVEIRDHGVGIAADELAHVKKKFFRGRGSGSGGSGLGLAIADRIAKAHGGDLVIQSAANAGTTVKVTLPMS